MHANTCSALFGLSCVRRLYGGSDIETSARLIGFEGTLSKHDIEKLVFWNYWNHLRWQAAATPLTTPRSMNASAVNLSGSQAMESGQLGPRGGETEKQHPTRSQNLHPGRNWAVG